ncbi:transaldolase [Aulographum hederae CBS 113979]|uniref:Transaldolase n=1 Tax=Aulographum hederae CBS 113979 TaxID=1176131 RepID=A0A6G1GX63_9PEZI|nr:transaldolase [Aulographum hederae CBS 113979]
MPTLLDLLKRRSTVDCDTLDASVPESLGPFTDCTSNQAIAYFELQRDHHDDLIKKSIIFAEELSGVKYKDIPVPEMAVDVAMIQLQCLIAPHISGLCHIQTNPFDSYSTERMVEGAKRIDFIFQMMGKTRDDFCIKIPATWEGLQACKVLSALGIKTLATTLFAMEQVALAAEAGCTYIAPYVNELKVHFDKGYRDVNPNFALCVQAQRYMDHHDYKTKVLPASLTSVDECMRLAGAHHITIAPPLLRELAKMESDEDYFVGKPSLFDSMAEEPASPKLMVSKEASFRMAFTRRNNGNEERKLIQAINIFCDMQLALEQMMEERLCDS